MPSPFSLGVQNADEAFDAFVDSQITVGLIASATGSATVTTATLGFTPDWVVFSLGAATDDFASAPSWVATSTTLTFTKSTTTAASVSYIAGNLS